MSNKLITLSKLTAKFLLLLVVFFIVVRLCFFDVFRIPSDSMKDQLKPEDLIVVNKTLFSGLGRELFIKLGFKPSLKKDDIIVFKIDLQKQQYYVKRCIGLPGNKLEILTGQVKVNDQYIDEPNTVRKSYNIWHTNFTQLNQLLTASHINLYEQGYQRHPNYITINLNYDKLGLLLKNKNIIDSIKISNLIDTSAIDFKIGHKDIYNLSPQIIPYKGMTINCTKQNLLSYKTTLQNYEGVYIDEHNSKFLVNGKSCTNYTFKNDYFFVLGDNREDSIDSRYIGVIPEKNITGKYIAKNIFTYETIN